MKNKAMKDNAITLARAVWKQAKEKEMTYDDVVGCCAALVVSINQNAGEPVHYVVSEIIRRAKIAATKLQ